MRGPALVVLLSLTGFTAGGAPPSGLELERLRRDLARERAGAERLKGREQGLLRQLGRLERQVNQGQVKERAAQARVEEAAAQVRAARERLRHLEASGKDRRKLLRRRLLALYRFSRLGRARLLLLAPSLPGMVRLQHALATISGRDRRLLEELEGQRQEALALRRKLAQERRRHQERLRQLKRQQQEVERARRQRRRHLAQVRGRRHSRERLVEELEQAARRLERILARERARKRRPRGSFKGLKGHLARPLPGRILRPFGRQRDPRFGTVTFQKGILLGGPRGGRVRAVAAGTVVWAGWLRGYGNLVILDHGGGWFTLYGHLGQLLVEQGQEQPSGAPLGRAGEGAGGRPGAYFEIRQHGHALDPSRWFSPPHP